MIKVKDVAYGRLRVPDLDAMEEFLTDFGMRRAARTKTRLYMRGTGSAHHLHISEQGEQPGLIGFAFYAKSENDLNVIAKAPGASAIESLDEPGGGKRVRLTDPNGFQIEVVHGIETVDTAAPKRQAMNWRDAPVERTEVYRVAKGPSHVKRMGHAVLDVPDVVKTVSWYREMFGLIQSDDVYDGAKDNIVGSFNRTDCGTEYVDHHVFFCRREPVARLNHLSFEVADIDDVFVGHEYLKARGKYQHFWGIGRHLLGSQVFDYWRDPWGHVHEHWTDSDRLNAGSGSALWQAGDALTNQWGPGNPSRPPQH
jgi:catechol 2,3-dioxygenase-like lactoylglutathione lyase family enzyme